MRHLLWLSALLFASPLLVPAAHAAPISPAAPAHVQVLNAINGAPIEGARLQLIGTGRQARTDARGRATLTGAALSAAFRQVRITAPGYIEASAPAPIQAPVRLWPTTITDAQTHRVLAARAAVRPIQDDPDDPALKPSARALLQADPTLMAPGDLRLKQGVEVPATVRLWRRPEGVGSDRSCDGPIEEMPLEEYVRGVVPHEWIPSWDLESLRAGAVAARTYSAWWVVNGGKYDCADLDDTPRSQAYRDARNARGDTAVRDTEGQVIVRDGALVFAEYSAENSDPTAYGVDEPLCTGRELFGHGRGMCQWGTQRWATERQQTWPWMVRHYYPGASVAGAAAQGPDLHLRQRMARVDEVTCADPEGSFGCADFVGTGWSAQVFDLFVGHRVRWQLEITNQGQAGLESQQATVRVALPNALEIRSGAVGGADLDPGAFDQTLDLPLPAIGAGETLTISLELLGRDATLARGRPVGVESWMLRIGDVYQKLAWADPPSVNAGQTYNGGDLRALYEMDIFDPRRWGWDHEDAAMTEGWTGPGVTVAEGALVMPQGTADSPWLPLQATEVDTIRYEGDAARLWWRGPDQPFDAARSLDLVAGEITLPESWAGAIQQIRLTTDGAGEAHTLAFVLSGAGAPDAGPGAGGAGGQGGQGGVGGQGGQGAGGAGGTPDGMGGGAEMADAAGLSGPRDGPRRYVHAEHNGQGGCAAQGHPSSGAIGLLMMALLGLLLGRRRRL